jgi:hypothetical protein
MHRNTHLPFCQRDIDNLQTHHWILLSRSVPDGAGKSAKLRDTRDPRHSLRAEAILNDGLQEGVIGAVREFPVANRGLQYRSGWRVPQAVELEQFKVGSRVLAVFR